MNEKVCVLMTTYNPTEYLLEQIESIIKQKDVDVKIIIRDDASRDKIYLEKAKQYKNVLIIEGEKNVGVRDNIKELIQYAVNYCTDTFFFAYSDQDDVWLEDKIITGINRIKELDENKGRLYYSNLLVVNENLQPSHVLQKKGVVKNTLGQSLAQIFLFACTAMFDYRFLAEVNNIDMGNMGFDHLIYYYGILNGNIYYDYEPHILYRQHGNNVSGVKKKGFQYIFSKIDIIFSNNEKYSFKGIAKYLLDNMEEYMTEDEKYMVNQVASMSGLISRIMVACNKRIRAGYYPKDFYRTLRLIFNKY